MPHGGPSLADILLGPAPGHAALPEDHALVVDCVRLVERHVAGRDGLRGVALKTGLGMARAARPQILPHAMQRLLPEFAAALEPLYRRFRDDDGRDFAAFLTRHEDTAVTALLAVADGRVAASPNAAIKAVYARLRGGAEAEVAAVLPALAGVFAARLPR